MGSGGVRAGVLHQQGGQGQQALGACGPASGNEMWCWYQRS